MRKKLRVFLLLAIAVMMIGISAVPTSADAYNGWFKYKGTYYYMNDGVPVKGWQKIDGNWYYFDEFMGAIQVGWVKYGGNYYYLDPSTGKLQTGFIKYDGNYYYCSPSTGALQTGWVKAGGKYYYFDKKTGALKTGWVQDSGNWYYLDPATGVVVTGWLQIGKDWYYFSKSTGALERGYDYIVVEPPFEEMIIVWIFKVKCMDCEYEPTFTGTGETEEEAYENAMQNFNSYHEEITDPHYAQYDESYETVETEYYEGSGYYEEWILVDGKKIAV